MGELRSRFAARTGGELDLRRVVLEVSRIPYGRPSVLTSDAVVDEWRGTCSTKHLLLADLLADAAAVRLWHRPYRVTRDLARERWGAEVAAAVPPDGLTDVHTFATVRIDGRDVRVDVTFPLPDWDGRSDLPLACGPGRDVPAGPDPLGTKARLVEEHCDPSVRESFIAALSHAPPPPVVVARPMRDAYDRIAPVYAERRRLVPDEFHEVATRVFELTGPEPRVLDVGCGHGRDARLLGSLGASVVGLDASMGMLAEARGVCDAPLLQSDMGRIGLRDEAFDAVWCAASLLHVPKAEAPRALREMRRVLRPGGVLWISVQEGDGDEWKRNLGVDRYFVYYSPEELRGLLSTTGFEVLESGLNRVSQVTWLTAWARAR